jgi:uncharacterized protein (DUF1501 family)
MNRRNFLKGCATFSALAATRGFGITNLVFANSNQITHHQSPISNLQSPNTPPPNNRDLLLFVFVRGGMDGLNLLVPHNVSAADRSSYYNALRPTLNIPAPNSSAARKAIDLDGKFGFHPDVARGAAGVNVPNQGAFDTGGLYELFKRGDLAVVTACGSPDITGSHFDTELYVDQGGKTLGSGWLTRYLQAVNTPSEALVAAPQNGVPPSLSGWYGGMAIPNPENFGGQWHPWAQYNDANNQRIDIAGQQRTLLQGMFSRGSDYVEAQGQVADAAYTLLNPLFRNPDGTPIDYAPAAGVSYLTSTSVTPDYAHFANSLQTVARLAKANIGSNPLRVACVDVGGGWDTHDNQGLTDWGGNARFPRLVTNLSTNLKAFCDDMNADPAWRGHYTIVVVSEFGRVLYQNDSGGCDHGAGNVLLLIGSHDLQNRGNVNGGQVYGNWPGLQKLGFNDGLNITTDYRTVLADVLFNRMGATKDQINNSIFPGLNFGGPLGYTDLGLLNQQAPSVGQFKAFIPAVNR